MSSKPKVIIYATGGTIAGAATSASSTAAYSSGVVSVISLIQAVPQIKDVAEVLGRQMCNVGSPDLDSEMLVRMSQQIQKDLDDPGVSGVVVTHGTDTIEETAFFLDLTLRCEKPVVLVGSMRPSTSLSADGPLNLLEAVRLASCKAAGGRGVMVVLNDRICPARFTTKTNANRVETFQAGDHGLLGTFENSRPVFFHPPTQAKGSQPFDISSLDSKKGLPKVNILYGHLEADDDLFAASLKSGVKGVVLAGMGAGCWVTDGGDAIDEAMDETGQIPVIASYRTTYGYVHSANSIYGLGPWAIGGGYLNPPKCRIQLQLCLATGLDIAATRTVFEM
ncbi:hypothetical protein FZEAL_8120 [Fusarium zealandicum]|uniref:asparaginase n=1 Tax=Fusarium zealandicum TaxID=1053134 RepID=A0A8H4UF49_9HYPO|nr:hypothetical protein FZEAL_8120 [Fusarium zealandicum]